MLDDVRSFAGAVIAASCAFPAAAAADPPARPASYGVAVAVGGSADSAAAASGHVGLTGWIINPRGADRAFSVDLGVDIDRVPWLSAPRELFAAPYSAATARLLVAPEFGSRPGGWYGDYGQFPVEMFAGVLDQDGRGRRLAGGRGTAMNVCWERPDGEPTCVGWFGGGGSGIADEERTYSTVVIDLVPVTGLVLGPVRIDARQGLGSATRQRNDVRNGDKPELGVKAVVWDLRARGRVGCVDLAVATRRQPYASTDGAMAMEDRVEATAGFGERTRLTATTYAARTRWWTDADTRGTADTVGAELALSTRVAGFDVLARGAVGRTFYPALDATLLERPVLGARITIDIQRTFTLYQGARLPGS
jgi:hypothetical protein